MTIEWEAGRVRLLRGDVATFDSDKRNMLITDFVTASFALAPIPTQKQAWVKNTVVVDLGAISPYANIVMGMQERSGIVEPIGGTTVAAFLREHMDPTSAYRTYTTGDIRQATCVWYYFEAVGGRLKVTINYRAPIGTTQLYPGETVKVSALCGTFDF